MRLRRECPALHAPRPEPVARAAAPCHRRTRAAVRPPARPRLPTPARRCTTAAPGAGDPRRARTIGSNDSLRISIPDAASFGAEVDAAVQAGVACDVPHDAAKPHAVVIDATP